MRLRTNPTRWAAQEPLVLELSWAEYLAIRRIAEDWLACIPLTTVRFASLQEDQTVLEDLLKGEMSFDPDL